MQSLIVPYRGRAGVMRLKNGTVTNYGSDGVLDGYFYFYTGLGLREMFNPNPLTEDQKKLASELRGKSKEELMKSGHYARIALSDIESFD